MKQLKLNLTFLLTVLMSMVGAKASAHDIEVANADGVTIYYVWNSDKTELSVTYYGNHNYGYDYSGNVVIPSSVTYGGKEYSVTSIGNSAFSDCSRLTSVTIPNSVTTIGDFAFYRCSGLTSVEIPNSVTNIGDYAFMECSGLTSVEIPNSVKSIGDYVFRDCSDLTSVTIPNSVTSIGNYAFMNCNSLTSVDINNNAILSKDYTSYSSLEYIFGNQVQKYIIGNSVTSIGSYAFDGCKGLTSVEIPNSVTSIGSYAFNNCFGLKKVIVKDIAAWCNIKFSKFSGDRANPLYYAHHLYSDENTEITDLVIPNSVTSISKYAFYGCSGLTSVVIPNSVTSIGDYAFYECSGLTSIEIPNSVTSIGQEAFDGTAWFENQPDGVVYAGKLACLYKGTMSSDTHIEFVDGTVGIAEGAFLNCSELTSVTIPNSVTSIGGRAFYGCSGLTSIEIPNSVTSIGDYAFDGCSGLTSVEIPNSVTSIGSGAFNGCSGLKKVIVKDIAAWCNIKFGDFYSNPLRYAHHLYSDENTEITDLVIPNSVTSISKYAFYGCSGLTSVEIPNSVTSIGDYAFESCSGLVSVEIPNSVTSIGSFAFSGCSGLISVEIPNSVTSIGQEAFRGCSDLTSVTSLIEEPFDIRTPIYQYMYGHIIGNTWEYPFLSDTYNKATLYVPVGTKEKYKATEGWKDFANIVELDAPQDITPIDQGETIDFGNEIDEDTNLDGNVVGNVFININDGDGSYDTTEGCIIVNKATDDSAIDGKDIFSQDFKDNFTGIVFMANEGKGTIKVEAETQGNMVLKVKIGDNDPIEMELDGKLKVKFPYNVTEETLVYVYGGMSAAGAKASRVRRAPSSADALKIYGVEVVNNPTDIDAVDAQPASSADAPVYNLNGQRVNVPVNGIYIKNGRKVVVK